VLLKIPNHEVRQSLERGYVSRLLGKDFELDAMRRTAVKSARKIAEEGYTVYYVGVNYKPAENVRTTDDIACERA